MDKHGIRRIATVLSATAASGAILFAAAGRLDWFRGWVYLALHFACVTVAAVFLALTNPELLNERGKRHSNTEPFEKLFAVAYVVLLTGLPLVAGLDAVRFGWSSPPPWIAYPGALLFVGGEAVIIGCMRVNPFLETTVRVQPERGQRVIRAGPYRLIRHPMYAGLILQNLAVPLVLGSPWAFVPASLIGALFAGRAYLEDRVLRQKLWGYAQYAEVTRYLIVPGVW
jgi:protein-S-isoprenylcysteine O-methyltransferase Ste14